MAKQKDGRYRAKITVGTDASGKSIVKYVSGRTKKELEAAKAAAREKYVTGANAVPEGILFDRYALSWYEVYKQPHIGVSAQMSYRTALYKHIFPALAGRRLTAITTEDLQRLLNTKADTCAAIIGNISTILRGVFQRAYSQGLIPRDITVGLTIPSKPKETRRALTDAETDAVLRLIDEDGTLMLALLYYTGMRYGEACGLQWRHIDFKAGTIRVEQQAAGKTGEIDAPKTDKSVRTIPMPRELADKLRPVRGLPQSYVVPSPTGSYHRNATRYRLWDDLMARLYDIAPEIDAIEKGGRMVSVITPHYLRHNYASVLYNAGVDVLSAQRYLGHANAKITLEIYSHLSAQKEKYSAEQLQGAFEKSCRKVASPKAHGNGGD